ncbi:MAG: hypothetical protein ACJ74Y_08805 [Bryobacteraceae bacterium]
MTSTTGLKNGALLAAAEPADLEIIITTDQEIPYQQNLASRKTAIVVLCAPTSRLTDLKPLIPATVEAVDSIKRGQVIRIP